METAQPVIEELKIDEIKKKSIKSVISLTVRRIILRIIGQISFIVLARVLSPEEFGIFTIVSFVVNFFGFFSDIGLAAALIQKKGELTKEDLQTTFTTQQVLVGILVIIIIFAAHPIVDTFYKGSLGNDGALLIQAMAFSLLLASLKSVPSVLLERRLQFDKLIIPEIVETLVYNIVVVLLALQGYGVWSFIVALLARGIIGLIILYILAPFPVGLSFNKKAFRQLFSFGLPYQLNGLIALIKDNVVPTYIGSTLGTTAVGYVGWSQKYAFLPLEVMNDIIRVTFPTYSRLQEHPELLKKALEKSLYFIALALYPMLFGFIALAPWIVHYVFTDKWINALPLFYLFCFSTFWACISTTFTNALFAIGKAKVVLNFMILWTILTWILTPLLTSYYKNTLGIGVSSAIISFTSIGVILVMKRYVNVEVIKTIGKQVVASVAMGLLVNFMAGRIITNIFMMFLVIAIGGVFYSLIMVSIDKKRLFQELKSIRRNL